MSKVIVFSRTNCLMCDEVVAHLEQLGVGFEMTDVSQDPFLEGEYGTRVPVIEVGGAVIFEAGEDLTLISEAFSQGRTGPT